MKHFNGHQFVIETLTQYISRAPWQKVWSTEFSKNGKVKGLYNLQKNESFKEDGRDRDQTLREK